MHLQPVAMLEVAVRHQLITIGNRVIAFPLWKWRLLLGRAHVGKDQTMTLEGLVGPLSDRTTIALTFFLFTLWERHAQTCAIDVKHHAVVAA